MNTNGANDKRCVMPRMSGSPIDQSLKDLFKIAQQKQVSDADPSVHFDCIEFTRAWIKEQDEIRGCVYNLADPMILELLSKRKTHIVVNYSDWMPKKGDRKREETMYRYNQLRCTCGIEGCKDGVTVFFDKTRYQNSMHHKFLIGTSGGKKRLLYGTFNMSEFSPQSLDSILYFRNNENLISTMNAVFQAIMNASVPWWIAFQHGEEGCSNWLSGYQNYLSNAIQFEGAGTD